MRVRSLPLRLYQMVNRMIRIVAHPPEAAAVEVLLLLLRDVERAGADPADAQGGGVRETPKASPLWGGMTDAWTHR